MFDSEFYPTPWSVASKMLEKLPSGKLTVLEPSAGKGDIAIHLKDRHEVFCIEKNEDLRNLLSWKWFRIVHDDFLEYPPEMKFDAIVMNPPFSNGDEHLLKALDIMENGTVVCLLNSATLDNPYSARRKLLKSKLASLGAEIEDLGDCFAQSERKTGVNVSMVTVRISKPKAPEIDWGLSEEIVRSADTIDNQELTTMNIAKNIEVSYHRAKELYDRGMEYFSEADKIMGSITSYYDTPNRLETSAQIAFDGSQDTRQQRLAKILSQKKAGIWHYVAQKMGIEAKITEAMRMEFNSKMVAQHDYAVTESNIRKFVESVVANAGNYLEDSILECFDLFTKYHPENREHVEGWKSNDTWKVNKRIVLPYWTVAWWGWDIFRMAYDSKHRDVEKALCILSGKRYNEIISMDSEIRTLSPGEKWESEFFHIRPFLKGTIHLYWKDENLRRDFNLFVAHKRNWLPPGERHEYEAKNREPLMLS